MVPKAGLEPARLAPPPHRTFLSVCVCLRLFAIVFSGNDALSIFASARNTWITV